MSVQVLAEPKCPILSVQQAIVTKAVDDKGVSLVPAGTHENIIVESRYYNSYMYRSYNQSFGLNLQRGDRNATTIKELKGKVAMTLLKEVRPEITVEKVLEAGKKISLFPEISIEGVVQPASNRPRHEMAARY